MAECITYIIDYSENEDFRKKCFQLLRYDLEAKILSNAKCEISFILSSIAHADQSIKNEFNFPGMMESLAIYGNGPDNETYYKHLARLENTIETASYCKSDLTQGLMIAMDRMIQNKKKFAERTIFVLSDMKKSSYSSVAISKIKEKSSACKIAFHTASESEKSTPFGNSVPIGKILQNSGFSRKIVQRRITKTPFYLFNSAEDTELEMKLQTIGKSERCKLVKTTFDKGRFEEENGVRLCSIPSFFTSIIAGGDQTDSEDEDIDEDEILTQMNEEIETIQKQVRNKVPGDEIQMRKELGGDLLDFGENCWRKIPAATKKGLHVIGKMSTVEAVQWYNFVGKETKILRGGDAKNQDVLNSIGECLDQSEKQIGLIASYKFQEKSVPKICFLQPIRCEDTNSYSFIFRYMPSSLTNRKLRAPRLQKPKQDIQDLVDRYMDAVDLEKLDFDDYKTELLSGHDLQLSLTRKILFGHDVDTNIYNFNFEEFQSQEIDSILSKIGEFHQSNRPKSRDPSKRVKAQPQGLNVTKKQKTDSTTPVMKDVTNVTDQNDTAGVTDDHLIRDVTNEEALNIPSKASPDRSIADSGMGASLASSVITSQKYSQLDDESDWSDESF